LSASHTHVFFSFLTHATTHLYTLSLHDALPIFPEWSTIAGKWSAIKSTVGGKVSAIGAKLSVLKAKLRRAPPTPAPAQPRAQSPDRKSTRLNSSHVSISYAVFCLKKKKQPHKNH